MAATFHGTTIGNNDLKFFDYRYIEIDFLGNAAMNKIMGVSNVNEDYEYHMLNVGNYLPGLGSREAREGM
jgi:hypothetical protein